MPIEQQLATIFEVIEGGAEVSGEIIPFPADAGATALEGTVSEVALGNGVATEVSQLTVVEGGATTTAGVGLLAMDVGAVGLAIAPALGILAGVGLYELAPEFWTNVSNALVEAGQTIGGKVRAFVNGENKTVGFSEETIEIFKNAFLNEGLFIYGEEITDYSDLGETSLITLPVSLTTQFNAVFNSGNWRYKMATCEVSMTPVVWHIDSNWTLAFIGASETPFKFGYKQSDNPIETPPTNNMNSFPVTLNGKSFYMCDPQIGSTSSPSNITFDTPAQIVDANDTDTTRKRIAYEILYGKLTTTGVVQKGATVPTQVPFPQTYPSWVPYTLPDEITKVYPIELPLLNPEVVQSESQNPEQLPDDNPDLLEWLLNNFPQPLPNPDPYPEPIINPDPDPQPEPEPIEPPTDPTTDPNPSDPNPEPTDPFLPVVPTMPDTVPANAMFTVYKPTLAQLNSFGGWLWSNNIIEMIKKIWQNPLDGIISFMKVYADPSASGTDTIKVGVLDSGVSSSVVSNQFVTVECGSISVNEKFFNATDYSPFVALHLYLPFIGIVELDIDEFMNGAIKVTYHIDIYTGTCLAEVKSKRSPDMTEWTIVYTFSGNASQQLPLTSAEFSGALSSLVGVVGGGLAIASGGGLGLLAGASGIAHAVTHEMVHLAHSGSLSANAGIMGARTPFLIITRRRSYDANGYNQLYGYPSNKTVFLNNCSGLVKVKDIQLETGATEEENNEIKALLTAGVII